MIILIVANLAVAIATNRDRQAIALTIRNMMVFNATPITFAACAADGIVRSQFFQTPLFAPFLYEGVIHKLSFSKYKPVDIVEQLGPGGGELVKGVRIGFEGMRYASGIGDRTAFEFA